ncbi:hypothetical protein VTL71DRAFT_13794 [Oculimacula yallundae]|uniref:Uncharacterized protein n=1 Tax=Oculimacula yallundae TaxID=86028 RepID=A0ABR4CLF6_9HELO
MIESSSRKRSPQRSYIQQQGINSIFFGSSSIVKISQYTSQPTSPSNQKRAPLASPIRVHPYPSYHSFIPSFAHQIQIKKKTTSPIHCWMQILCPRNAERRQSR